MPSLGLAVFLTAILLSFHITQVADAQYLQDYIPQRIPSQSGGGTTQAYFYQPTHNDAPQQVVDLSPQSVYLIYNCYYMKDICKNSANFYRTVRGGITHPTSGLPTYIFGYDFNTGKSRSSRQSMRRSHSCPTSGSLAWKNQHPCPEVDQRTVMRHNGPWYTTALEDGTTINGIKNLRGPNNQIVEYSKVRYSCDEFPPATWVEGGDNIDGSDPAETRCAAIRCGTGVKAEQDYFSNERREVLLTQDVLGQATAHGRLRAELERVIEERQTDYGHFPFWNPRNSVVLFGFTVNNVADGIAARVWTYSDPAMSQVEHESDITQAKRTEAAGNFTHHWPAEISFEELENRIKMGQGTEFVVPANDSFVNWSDLTGMNMHMHDMSLDWDEDEDIDDDYEYWSEGEVKEARHELEKPVTKRQPVLRSTSDPTITPLLKRASAQDLQSARKIVQAAITQSSKLNKARLAHPLRNRYGLKPGTVVGAHIVPLANATATESVPPLLQITDEIAAAAALVAEADAVEATGNVAKRAVAAAGSYWMGSLARKGTVPWGDDPSYVVFRNVLDYGAVGDGVTDDTKAITKAMTDGKRCGEKCNGSTTKNAIVYFPPGTYLISSTIAMPFGTQVIGDANDRPTLVASSSFVGLGVLSTDEYSGGGTGIDGLDQEYYVNTANFYRQIRNIIIDITKAPDGQQVTCLHYQVAQATSLQNVELRAAAGSSQTGMYAENGSGGQISDVTFTGGGIGLYGGNQQFTAQRLTFNGCTTGVQVIWDWGWVWKSVTMNNVDVGFKLLADNDSGNIGSISILDSSFTNVGKVVVIAPPSSKPGSGSTGVVLENVALSGVSSAVADTSGNTLLDGSAAIVNQWALGPVYEGSTSARSFSQGGKIGNYRRHSTLLDSKGAYFERPRPQYEDQDVGQFVHVKDLGATGDGTTDDTAAFQAALYASLGKILFVDAGSYILTSTVTIPSGAKIVGETWSQLVASGSYFEDASNPKVLLKVGNAGDVGDVEMQDLLFTTRGPTAGLILVEWNIQAASAGSAGLWDCHARIGGATGTQLTPAECPPVTSGIDQGCSAASLMMHLTKSASGYFENMWLWGSDHMIDDPDLSDANNTMVQNTIYVARGFLIESTQPTWLYATASEHSVFYQYNFNKATNIFAGMLQTETPYFQPSPQPPAPFEAVVGDFPGDPDYTCASNDEFSGCDESWSVIIRESENIFIAGAGLYSWFSSYAQTCIDTQECQKTLLLLDSNFANVRIQNLITIGAKYMAVMDGTGIPAKDNLNVDTHPDWSQISILDVGGNGTDFNELVWIDPAIWDMDEPQFTCSPPCNVKLPPWTSATSTVNYPLLTVSDGTWKSTITQPPITISQWVFEVVTLSQGGSNNANNQKIKRQGFDAFWPVLSTTPYWPAVVYTGPDGSPSTTAPSVPFPTPPPSIGPGAPAPPKGSWPKRAVQPFAGQLDQPLVGECDFFDFLCVGDPWIYGNFTDPDSPDDDDNENWEELQTICPTSTSTKTSKTTTATTPTKSPFETGDPMQNEVHCYNSGENTEHERMDNAANDFCNQIGRTNEVLAENFYRSSTFEFPYNGGIGIVEITLSLEIKPGCDWTWDFNECHRYLEVPVDSCNCGGVNWKQGGTVENNCYKWRIDPNVSLGG
ncbi:pectate lyase superfamily protein-domain-containing protein [Xylogone sp. PMI_703]|nr:pectate lyase superfamily protein-domain-containing protein [Xylogone sp. PMI_703]